jgi:hypothetical protein
VAISGETPGVVRKFAIGGHDGARLTVRTPLSSPGLGRPSTPRPSAQSEMSLEYWVTRFRG